MWDRNVVTWARERFPLLRYGLMIAYLEVARHGLEGRVPGLLLRIAVSAAALFALRLADDLASLQHDRARHLDRLLVRVASLEPFHFALVVSASVAFALAASGPHAATAVARLLLVAVFAALLYRRPLATGPVPLLRAHLPLFKYPALVAVLAAGQPLSLHLLAVLALVFATFSAFELLDDAELRQRGGAQAALAGAIAVLALLSLALAPAHGGRVAFGSTALCVSGFLAQRGRARAPALGYALFCATATVLIAIGGTST